GDGSGGVRRLGTADQGRRRHARSAGVCQAGAAEQCRAAQDLWRRRAKAVRDCNPSDGALTMLGKLTWDAIPFDQPIPLIASSVVLSGIGIVALYTLFKGWWPYLWREWITTVDHKRLGIMYALLALVMLVRGFIDALMMRSQQALAAGSNPGYLPPEHYD